jgi:hypothetical protein
MIVEVTINEELIKEIITHPRLFNKTQGKGHKPEEFKINPQVTYLVLRDGETNLGIIETLELTNCVLEVHIHILPITERAKMVKEQGAPALHEYIRNAGYKKLFTRIPATCGHVLKLVQELHYICCGSIDKGIIFNGLLQSVFFYEFEV